MQPLERAARSKELLENAVFKEVMAAIKQDLIASLETSGFDDVDKHHELTLTLQALKRIRTQLERWVADGVLEEKKINDQTLMERMTQRWKRA